MYIQRQVFFHTGGKITIEDSVGIGYQTTLITGHHEIGPGEQRWGPLVRKDIYIGKGTWITSRVLIWPGVSIGAGSIVAAGAVVMRSMPANCLIGGVPAKVIKQIE
jgi:maltose O-acetyltransferase